VLFEKYELTLECIKGCISEEDEPVGFSVDENGVMDFFPEDN
jgi:hypothetical protein